MAVSSVEGGSVYLPCNMTSPIDGDKVRLVLWFKNNSDKPIYTFDTRGKLSKIKNPKTSHWVHTLFEVLEY